MWTFIRRHASRGWREPALWMALGEAGVYLGVLAYMLNVIRIAIGD
jgi:hypothetical protein